MQNSADSRIIGDQSILHFPVGVSGSKKKPRITNLSMNFSLRLINKPSFSSQCPNGLLHAGASAEGKRTVGSENAEHLSHKRCSDQSYLGLCSYLFILTGWIFGVVYWSQCIWFPDFSDWDVVPACALESCNHKLPRPSLLRKLAILTVLIMFPTA